MRPTATTTSQLRERGPHNRFQFSPGSSHAEVGFYREATDQLLAAGYPVLMVDCTHKPPEQAAALIAERLTALLAIRRM